MISGGDLYEKAGLKIQLSRQMIKSQEIRAYLDSTLVLTLRSDDDHFARWSITESTNLPADLLQPQRQLTVMQLSISKCAEVVEMYATRRSQ